MALLHHDELNEMHDQTAALILGVHLGIDNANIAFHVYPYHALARMGDYTILYELKTADTRTEGINSEIYLIPTECPGFSFRDLTR